MPWFAAVIPALGAAGAGAAGAGLGALGSGLAGATAGLGALAPIGGALGAGLSGLGTGLGAIGTGLGAAAKTLGALGAAKGVAGSALAAPSLSLAQPAAALSSFNPAALGLSNAPLSTLAGSGSLSSGLFAPPSAAGAAGGDPLNFLGRLGKLIEQPIFKLGLGSMLQGRQGPPSQPISLPAPERRPLIDPNLYLQFLRR